MQSDALREHVFPDASHLNGISREKAASIDECWSLKANRIIPLVHNEHPCDLLISVYDEITSEFETILLLFDEFFL